MKRVLEITKQTQKERNDLMLEAFFYWAGKNTNTITQYQITLISKPIKKWFFQEYEKLEKEFINFINRHPNATIKDNERLYARITGKIYSIYPSVFIDEIKNKYKGIPMHNLN